MTIVSQIFFKNKLQKTIFDPENFVVILIFDFFSNFFIPKKWLK